MPLINLEDIERAASRIRPYVLRTPLLTSAAIDDVVSTKIFGSGATKPRVEIAFKAEHLQVVGAFKSRGAANAIQSELLRLKDANAAAQLDKLCVLTHSSGNHGAALACQARQAGVVAAVVMPSNAPDFKKANVCSYGARVWYCEPTQHAREAMANAALEQLQQEGFVVKFIHPYDNADIQAGQGTMAAELLQQVPNLEKSSGCSHAAENGEGPSANLSNQLRDGKPGSWAGRGSDRPVLDMVIAPVGGGGMLSGVSTAVKSISPGTLVIGAEPEGADDAQRSLATHTVQPAVAPVQTICDGLLTSLSSSTLAHIEEYVDSIATVSDRAIVESVALVAAKMKQLIEPSAGVGLACLLENAEVQSTVRSMSASLAGAPVRIGIVISGGNTTIETLANHFAKHL